MGNDLNYYNTTPCGSDAYLNNEELIFIFEAPTSELYQFALTNASENWTSLKLYDGCPLLDQGGACVAQVSGVDPERILDVDLVQGQTYYLVISRYYEECFEFDLSINTWCQVPVPMVQFPEGSCPGQEMPELTVENPVGTVNWYADANLTILLGTGATFQPDGDFSQVVYVTNTLECESAALKVPVPVYSAPAITLLQGQEGMFLQENQIRYAQRVEKFSSQNSAGNTASSALGLPDVYPQYGNLPGAWMPQDPGDAREYIVLGFPDPQPATSLVVFETFHPGAIDTIWGFNPGIQSWEILWAGDAFAAAEESRIFQVNFPETDYDLQLVRLAFNLSVLGGLPAIDAAGLMNPSNAVCQDQYVTLNLPYGENVLWSTGETSQSISFMPGQSETITVQSEFYGCNFSSSVDLTVLEDVSPEPVSNMTPEDGTLNVSLTPTLNWINGANTSDVDLFFWPANEDQPTEPIVSNHTGMQITLTSDQTEPNTEYKWQIISNHYLCNNTAGPVQHFFTRDLPNLQVSNLQVESNGYTGEPVQVSFVVTNAGNATTGSISWKDAVFLSSDTELSLDDDVLLGVKNNPKFLLPGESYAQNLELTIPPENLGNYHIIVATNFNCRKKLIGVSQINYVILCSNPLEESTLDDNFLVSETSLAFALPPLPDLIIENFAAPDIAFAGDTINITYTVTNAGNKLAISQNYRLAYDLCKSGGSGVGMIAGKSDDPTAQNSKENQDINPLESWVALMTNFCALIEPLWTDDIFLSTDNPGFLPPEANRLNGSFVHFKRENYQGAGYELPNEYQFNSILERIEIFERWDSVPGYLDINQSYQRQLQVVLPNCIEGEQFLYVSTDHQNWVWEEITSNNVFAKTIQILPTPPPDIIVESISADENIFSGTNIDFQYTLVNSGAGKPASDYWVDLIYLSPGSQLDTTTAILLKSNAFTGGLDLEPDGSVEISTTLNIPDGLEGSYYLIVHSNAYEMVCEFDLENNMGSFPIEIQLTPPPDLLVTNISVPDELRAETIIPFSYAVNNQGSGTAAGSWLDKIYLTTSDVFVPNDNNLIGSRIIEDTLVPGASHMADFLQGIPRVPSGNWYLYVHTDANDNVYEHGNDQNNIYQYGPFELLPRLTSDLMVEDLTLPADAQAGEEINYSFSMKNTGEGPTNASEWLDVFFISEQPFLSSDTVRLARRLRSEPLDVDQTYQREGGLIIPNGFDGDYYIHLVADAHHQVENDETRENNILSIPVQLTQSPTPDLVLTSIDLPPSFTAGEELFIQYTVQNQGSTTVTAQWYDEMMLTMSPGSHTSGLGHKMQERILEPGASYTDSILAIIPFYYSGSYYFVFSSDDRDDIYEHTGENNNLTYHPVTIIPAEPADLIVESIESPASAVPGRAVSYAYTVTNAGDATVKGRFLNNVYLESDFLPDFSNTMLWDKNLFNAYTIEPGASTTFTVNKSFPGIKDGPLQSFVMANATQALPETDYENNIAYADQPISSNMPLLPLNESVSDTLAAYASVYYRLNLPEDADLRIKLNSNLNFTENALYLRTDNVPSGPLWDHKHQGSNNASPTMMIPGTTAGDNYLRVSSFSLNFQNITLQADILPYGIDSISPSVMGQGRVTSVIYGAGFREGATVELTDGQNNPVVQGTVLQFRNSMQLQVRWQLEEVPVGVYNLRITNPNEEIALLAQSVTVEPAEAMDVEILSAYNEVIGTRNPATVGLIYQNTSNVDIPYVKSGLFFYHEHELVSIAGHEKLFTRSRMMAETLGASEGLIPEDQLQPPGEDPEFLQKVAPVIIRDLAPGENVSFSLTFRNFPISFFSLSASTELLTENEFLTLLGYSALSMRHYILTSDGFATELEYNASEMAELYAQLNNENDFIQSYFSDFVNIGLLDQTSAESYLYDCPECPDFPDSYATNDPWADNAVFAGDYDPTWLKTREGMFPDPPSGCDNWGQAIANAYCKASDWTSCIAGAGCIIASPLILKSLAGLFATGVGSVAAAQLGATAFLLCKGMIIGCAFFLTNVGPTSPEGVVCSQVVEPCDPNEIRGPWGYGDEQFIAQSERVNYTVLFENEPEFASAPAQGVRIELPISENANPLSVRLGSFGFADYVFEVPSNQASYNQRIDLSQQEGYFLDVVAGLDISNNRVFWLFETIDPATGFTPNDPFTGFLAVNDSTGIGEGFAEFSIIAHEATLTGDTMAHFADIYFDLNQPITTNTHFNTIDALPPTTFIEPLPEVSESTLVKLLIQSTDDPGGSGIGFTELYLSRNDSDFLLIARDKFSEYLVETEACDSLAFFARGVDNTGNTEPLDFNNSVWTVIGRAGVSAGEDQTICQGDAIVLTASEGSNYLWSNGETSQSITVSPDTTTVYSVVIRNETGCPGKASVTVFVEDCTQVNDPLADGASIRVFPNPVSKPDVFVELNHLDAGNYTLNVFDQNGRSVLERGISITGDKETAKLSLNGIQASHYFLEVSGLNFRETVKLVIVR